MDVDGDLRDLRKAMAEVRCEICRNLFIAGTIGAAMEELKRHEKESHGVREEKVSEVSEVLALNNWDRKFLFFCGISPN